MRRLITAFIAIVVLAVVGGTLAQSAQATPQYDYQAPRLKQLSDGEDGSAYYVQDLTTKDCYISFSGAYSHRTYAPVSCDKIPKKK